VVSCENFNLEWLKPQHVGNLLKKRNTADFTAANPKDDEWLTAFWDYWNKNSVAAAPSSITSIDNFPGVFRVMRGTASFYVQPQLLGGLPAVVEPSVAEHQQLCDKFPKLCRFDDKFMPKTLKDEEKSFDYSASFFRFIRALKSLAIEEDETLGGFVSEHLGTKDLKVKYLCIRFIYSLNQYD
jgi:sacsin